MSLGLLQSCGLSYSVGKHVEIRFVVKIVNIAVYFDIIHSFIHFIQYMHCTTTKSTIRLSDIFGFIALLRT